MSLTTEQQGIVDYIAESEKDEIIMVNAIAGSGKTTLLVEITKTIPHKSGIYLAYNKSIATEAATKFPSSIKCSTIHSLAFRAVVRQHGLKVGSFGYKDIKEKIRYETKLAVLDFIKEFCLSSFTDFRDYAAKEELSEPLIKLCTKYLEAMYQGTISCSHDFYLKLFHMELASGNIEYDKQDFLLIDEAGDINEVALEIFKHFPAKTKIATGDRCQNVYSFNHTINAFELLKDDSVKFDMTQSFRVSDRIAPGIENFCQKYIDPEMDFKGVPVEDNSIDTRAIISRTNSGLIAEMINLSVSNTGFTLVRKASEIFKVSLMLCFLKYQGKINDPAYKHIQKDVDEWYEDDTLRMQFKSPLVYITHLYEHDIGIVAASRLLMSKGKNTILTTYDFAKSCEGNNFKLFLATAHSSKGLEFDEVTIHEDLNNIVERAIDPDGGIDDEAAEQEFNLYYVACSRAKKVLNNARHL